MSEGRTRKRFKHGSHRWTTPIETFRNASRHLAAMGITRVANVTGLDCIGLPVVMVCRPNARSLSVAQGKGLDLDAARASGLMEAIEQYHAEHITLPLKLATFHELLRTHEVVDVDLLPRTTFSAFHRDLRMLWIEGIDLATDARIWLPYETVHIDFTVPLPPGSGCFPQSSNGLASGNHPLEAICHGICEVIERDAMALWRHGTEDARRGSRLDLATVDDASCRAVLEKYQQAGVYPAVWEITSDLGVPAFYCHILDAEPRPWWPLPEVSGMGCHTTRDVALLRALTEAAQSRLTMIAGSRDDMVRDHYTHHTDPDVLARAREALQAAPQARSFLEVPTVDYDTFEEDLAWLETRLGDAGFHRIMLVDLTRPEFDIPVVRVMIPGLEGHSEQPGYVPGPRLRNHALRAAG